VARPAPWIALASGAAAFLVLTPCEAPQVKGGELALELIRMGPEGQWRTPDRFLNEDRFKVLLTCPPRWRGYADVLAFQGSEATAPLVSQRIDSCGNRRSLPGAFQLTGSAPATICAIFSELEPLDRSALPDTPNILSDHWVCRTLESAARGEP
jgi:hypothetical protein